MALPSWRDQIPHNYTGARKWGTGINPIHSVKGGPQYKGRNIAPGTYNADLLDNAGLVAYDFGFMPEDQAYEYPAVDMSYLKDHPNWGAPDPHGTTGSFPPRTGQNNLPSGIAYRARKMARPWNEGMPNTAPNGTVGEGWLNKEHGEILDSRISDSSQYTVWTSERQRDLSKGNDVAVVRGTDDARHVIASRITGMKVRIWPDGKRHEEMENKTQEYRPRPWKYRSAGVGPYEGINDMHVSIPRRRDIPADVDQGTAEVETVEVSDWEDFY